MSFCWQRRSRSRVGCSSSSSSSLYDLAEAFCLSPRAQNEDELEAMRKKREALAERMAALQRFKALQQGSGGPGGGS